MSDALPAASRAELYGLLARVVTDGVGEDDVVRLRALPALAGALDPDASPDALAARHHATFGLHVPPFAGALLEPDGSLGGAVTASAEALWGGLGLPPRHDVPADHLGLALAAMAWLSGAEADAVEDGADAEVARMQALQRHVLDDHLLGWIAPLHAALAVAPWRLGFAVVDLAAELAGAHRASLGGAAPDVELPDAGALLDEPRTGLKDVARRLATPARCGAALTVADVVAVARATGVPHGFGGRFAALETLLLSAADHQAIPAVCAALIARLDAITADYQALAAFEVPVATWTARLQDTRALLARLAAAAG